MDKYKKQLIKEITDGNYEAVKLLLDNSIEIDHDIMFVASTTYTSIYNKHNNADYYNIIELLLIKGHQIYICSLAHSEHSMILAKLAVKYNQVNVIDEFGSSLLHHVGHSETIKYLVENGANVDIVNTDGYTILFDYLTMWTYNDISIINLYLKYSKDPKKLVATKTQKNVSALSYMNINTEIFRILLEYVDNINTFLNDKICTEKDELTNDNNIIMNINMENIMCAPYQNKKTKRLIETENLEVYKLIVNRPEFDDILYCPDINMNLYEQKLEIFNNRVYISKSKSANKKCSLCIST